MIALSLLTHCCIAFGLALLILIAVMFCAILRDRRELDEQDRLELEDDYDK